MSVDDRARWRAWMREQYRDSSKLKARAALHARFSTNPESWFRWLYGHMEVSAGALLLELGCGPGDLWIQNRNRLPDRFRVVLTDLSEGMVRDARGVLADLGAFRFAVADVQAIPVAAASVDDVVANQMLSHVPDVAAALREIHRVLRSGGRLLMGTSGRVHMRELLELLQGFDASVRWDGDEAGVGLETAARVLAPLFGDIRVERYADRLVVTEAAPLVDYVFSLTRPMAPATSRRAEFQAYVADSLARSGAISITKEMGIVIATRP